jgi:hypothetical protein
MTFSEIKTYIENLCRSSALVRHTDTEKHFFRINIEDLTTNWKAKGVKSPAVFLEIPEGKLSGETNDNAFNQKFIALSFLKTVKAQDADGEELAYEEMEVLGWKFMAKINKDYEAKVIKHFRHNEVRYFKVGPISENMYGIRFELPMGAPATDFRNFKTEDWL